MDSVGCPVVSISVGFGDLALPRGGVTIELGTGESVVPSVSRFCFGSMRDAVAFEGTSADTTAWTDSATDVGATGYATLTG